MAEDPAEPGDLVGYGTKGLIEAAARFDARQGTPFAEAVIRSSAVRAKPIVLTALAAMLGAFFILDDPIFSGLAISLIFGVLVSTALTLIIIPIMYYAWMRKKVQPANGV